MKRQPSIVRERIRSQIRTRIRVGSRRQPGLAGLLAAVSATFLTAMLAAWVLRNGAAYFSGQVFPLFGRSLAETIQDSVCGAFVPAAVYTQPGGPAEAALEQSLGWYGYLRQAGAMKAEPDEDNQEADQERDYIDTEQLQELFTQENEASRTKGQPGAEEQTGAEEQSEMTELSGQETLTGDEQDTSQSAFIPHTQQTVISDELLQDADAVLETFYTIDSNTAVSDGQIDAQRFLETDLTLEETESDGPQILIYHTHSQEGFADSTEGDPSTTIVGVGERLAQILMETYGYRVLHHTGEYDVPDRDTAYGEALPAIQQILEDNPSIEVVIDLHRDQMDESTRLVTDIDGRPTARFMFFNGLSYTKKTGAISYLTNENLEGNLAFSFQMQKTAAEYYPGLTRKIYLKGYRYNMHLRARTLLIELGAQNNTLEEAMNACEPLAHILSLVLQ